MALDLENERYVRIYTRDTVTWKRWGWQSKAVFCLLIRKVDRAGVLDLSGLEAHEAVGIALDVPCDIAAICVEDWLKTGTVTVANDSLCVPRYIEAQEARSSDRQRQKESRDRKRDRASRGVTAESQNVTDGHKTDENVTTGHTVSQVVTPSLALPSLAKPNYPCSPPGDDARNQASPSKAELYFDEVLTVINEARQSLGMGAQRDAPKNRKAAAKVKSGDSATVEDWQKVCRVAVAEIRSYDSRVSLGTSRPGEPNPRKFLELQHYARGNNFSRRLNDTDPSQKSNTSQPQATNGTSYPAPIRTEWQVEQERLAETADVPWPAPNY